ncbi:MAG: type I DNA topoisomerase [Oscillospiraceae bacterium]|jgi:DNA topoisomerase-1|nr:type I DNA topoisomerase [Oscillospiraceae bacterium]
MSKLVIVESPAKAKTIKKYLGKDYEVVASMGHIRDLPQKRLSVDIKNSFKPKYEIMKDKEKIVDALKKQANKSKAIFLATDPDREGEAISWHLAHILNLSEQAKTRVTFNEITKTGIQTGMSNPRNIDLDLVNAQQARRILDRLVGYKLSPFLSGKVRKGLSAGRVQSVAVRIIVDRENEIRAFVPQEYWTIDAKFSPKSSRKVFDASFWGNKGKKIKVSNSQEAEEILKNLKEAPYVVDKIKKGTRKRSPAPPFITSTLQQEASRKLGFVPRKTMKIAQELYEGVEVENLGAVGLITYMRTDSLRLSNDAINEAKEYIVNRWGEKYLPEKTRIFKSKASAQDGHEAIRPTMPGLVPDKTKNSLSTDQYKLYKLIWERFTACQMANCIHKTTQADILANDYIFKTSGYVVFFDGFTILYEESKDNKEEKAKELPPLEEGMSLKLKELIPNQHFTEPPPRYSEATLIKALEENGIGRPSTYAATITTILGREYVVREKKQLHPTELGEVITRLMEERFPKIVNIKFTALMESELDTVEKGKCEWVKILDDFYSDFEKTLKQAKEEMKDIKIPLKEDQTDIICELCGRTMVVKHGKYGKFIACPGYPDCKNVKKFLIEIDVNCPKCEGTCVLKKSKKGRIFYGCSRYPECDFVSWDEPIKEQCPRCGKSLFQKKGKMRKVYCITENCDFKEVKPSHVD